MEKKDVYIVGLDIGTTKIAAIVGKRDADGKIEILGMGKADSIGVTRGVVGNIENTVVSIKEAVKEAELKSGVDIKYVNVGIAGQHIKSQQNKGLKMREDGEIEISRDEIEEIRSDMFNLNMNPGEEVIDVIPQDYIIDNEPGIMHPVGMLGKKLEANFHIIVGQTTAAKNIYKCVVKAGLEVEGLILEPIASSLAVLSEEELEAGIALVDIGGGTTDVAIFHENIIRHTAVIPLGGAIVTEDVKRGCSIIKKYAEELKVKFGSALEGQNKEEDIVTIPGLRGREPREITLKNLARIIQARMKEIIEQVHSEIKNSGYEKQLVGGIVLTGGGSLLKHLKQFTAFVTGMDVRIGEPNEHLSENSAENITSPQYSTGVGLVIEGLNRWENDYKNHLKKYDGETTEEPENPTPEKEVEKKKKKKNDNGRIPFLNRVQGWLLDDN